jgi:tetratricopeptide (TPR) repeat protein
VRLGGLNAAGKALTQLEGVGWLLSRLDVQGIAPQTQSAQWLESGKELAREGRYEEAIEAFEEARDLAPRDVEPYLALSTVYEVQDELEKASAQLDEAAEIAPDDASVQQHRGRLLCMRHEVRACVETLEGAVSLDPEDASGHFWLGLAYQQLSEGGQDRALTQFREAIRLDPENPDAYIALGNLYGNQPGNEPLAVDAYKEAIRVAVEAGEEEMALHARAELAKLYYAQDQYDQCVDEWTQVLEANPDDPDAHRHVALCFTRRRETGDLERAVDAFETALALDFETIDVYYFVLGQHYAHQEDYVRAMLAWDQFLRFSDNPEVNAEVRRWIQAYRDALEQEETP